MNQKSKSKVITISSAETPSRKDICRMFDRIAPRYDLLNRLLSFRRDVAWRKKLASHLPDYHEQIVLDLATGTGDVLISLVQHSPKVKFTAGIDMAGKMLEIGNNKITELELTKKIVLIPGDAERIPFKQNQFDAVTIAFGIRNVTDVNTALREMYGVLKPGGRILILEFSLPHNSIFRRLYLFYFRYVLPLIGRLISGDSYAYRYLNRTVETFPEGKAFCKIMEAEGFGSVVTFPQTFGIAAIYRGDK